MIHEVKGDILLSHAQVIAHAIAPHDRFEHGLALSLREQWPAMVRDYSALLSCCPAEIRRYMGMVRRNEQAHHQSARQRDASRAKEKNLGTPQLSMSIVRSASCAICWKASDSPALPCRVWRRVQAVWIGIQSSH